MRYDDELLPCPFCGCRVRKLRTRLSKAWVAQCDSCDAGPSFEGSRDEVVAIWNRRATDGRDARIAELEAELAALKATAPIPPNSTELAPATPWYPDDSGEWAEVPEDLMEMPAGLSPEALVAVLTENERETRVYIRADKEAGHWNWRVSPNLGVRIVAYKVVKP